MKLTSSILVSSSLLLTATSALAQLHVNDAKWGVVGAGGRVAGAACDARPQMAKACDGKTFCQVYVDNRYLCGDPAPGKSKSLDVSYSCGGKQETLSFPETAQALLRCDVVSPPTPAASASKGLKVASAKWGVVGGNGKVASPSCDAAAAMAKACDGKAQCQVYVDARYLCADPAKGKQKSLEVSFGCGGKQETLSFPDSAQALLRCPQ